AVGDELGLGRLIAQDADGHALACFYFEQEALTKFRPVRLSARSHKGSVMSAKVLELPERVRCDRAARELREGVIGVLKEIHRHGGERTEVRKGSSVRIRAAFGIRNTACAMETC